MRPRERTLWRHRPSLDNLCESICFYAIRHPEDGALGRLLLKLGLENVPIEKWTGEQKDEAWHLLWKMDCRVKDGKHIPVAVEPAPPLIIRLELVYM